MKLNWAERLAVNNPLRNLQLRWEVRWLKKRDLLRPGARVLEIGCGRGIGAGLIQTELRPSRFQSMDLDFEMVRRAKDLNICGANKITSFFVGDVSRLPCRDASVDAVFGFGVLHHVPDWGAGLSEVARVLKAGGLYFMEEIYPGLYQNLLTKHFLLHPKEDRFTSEGLKKTISQASFSLLHALELKKFWILAILKKGESALG